MDIEIRKDVLLKALERCLRPSSASGKKDADDVRAYVGNVMITVNPEDKTANFYALSTYLSVDTAVPLENISEPGERIAVDTKRLHTMTQNLRGDVIQMVVHDTRLTVTGDHRRRYIVPLVDVSSFPPLQEPSKDSPSITLAGPKLAYLLDRVGHARDVERPNLDGIKLRGYLIEGRSIPTLEAAAINGYSVVVVRHAGAIEGTLPFDAFLPSKFLPPLADLNKESSVTLYIEKSFVFAETQDTLIGALLPHEGFLNYEQMIEQVKPFEPLCELPAVSLIEALRAIIAVRTSKAACVRFEFSGGSLQLDLWKDHTKATDTFPVRMLGERQSFCFFAEPQYVIDHLKGADGDCELYLTRGPLMFRTSDGYLGFLSGMNPGEDIPPEEPPKKKEKEPKKKAAKKDGPGPGKGRKKKATAKRKPKDGDEDDPVAAAERAAEQVPDGPGLDNETSELLGTLGDTEDDELGSADPSQYTENENG